MKYLVLLMSILLLSNCSMMPGKKMMSEVVYECEIESNFQEFASCIKTTYARKGNSPNAASVHAFYSMIDAINEDFINTKISNKQGRALTYKALLDTVEASNRAEAGQANNSVICNKVGNTVICN
jgi:hypothetical protein